MASSCSALTKTAAALMLVLFVGHLLAATPVAAAADGLVGRRSLLQVPGAGGFLGGGLPPVPLTPEQSAIVDQLCNDQDGCLIKIDCFRGCFKQCVGVSFPQTLFECCSKVCFNFCQITIFD